jgi:ABC-2 type transport system ATP-binding protein
MMSSIELQDVTVRYGDTTAVDRVSLGLQGPRIHGLLGRNGSGKTSLLSVVAAFRKATAGRILFDGQPVYENPAVTRQICFIRGSGDTVEHDWPGDKVQHALSLAADLRPDWDTDYAAELVDRFSLPVKARLGELSLGQRSALGVTLGLASRAPVTIFDESYLGLDAPSRYAFYDALLADYLAHPRTFVISTHLIEEVASLFEDVTIIDQGRVVLQESAEELRALGVAVTGPADVVADFTGDLEVLATRHLGPTRSDTIYGAVDDIRRRQARDAGLELGPVALQDLFVHLTHARAEGRNEVPAAERSRS